MMRPRHCLALLAGVSVLAACQGSEDQPTPSSESSPAEPPALPAVEAPLDREALLLAVVRTASDFALGRTDQDEQRELDGKRFAVRLRFGCPTDETRHWTFDERSRVLRISVEPEISSDTPMIASLGLTGIESVEGFWVRRPWMLQPACPASQSSTRPASEDDQQPVSPEEEDLAQAASAAAPARHEPHVGIAQFFTAEDSRAERRNDRAYEATVQLAEGERPSRNGYDLVLSGRLSSLPDGRVIACSGGADAAPSCVLSAAIDHVAVLSSAGETLAQWSRS